MTPLHGVCQAASVVYIRDTMLPHPIPFPPIMKGMGFLSPDGVCSFHGPDEGRRVVIFIDKYEE